MYVCVQENIDVYVESQHDNSHDMAWITDVDVTKYEQFIMNVLIQTFKVIKNKLYFQIGAK